MRTAAEIRIQVESALAERFPAALSLRPPATPELLSSGISEVDAALGGGLPLGGIAELIGADSSGRTTLALSTLAEATKQGESCAYVDASDALDPASAAALGVDLRRLLWVRVGAADAGGASYPFSPTAPAAQLSSSTISKVVLQNSAQSKLHEKRSGAGLCHPRNETHGLDQAIGDLFHDENSASNLPDFTPRCSESIRNPRPEPVLFRPMPEPKFNSRSLKRNLANKPWSRLDQALRATDLLLNTGGFRAIVLDMGDIPAEQARRVPLATWYRFRLQVEKSQTLFLLLTRIACTNSCAAVSMSFAGANAQWQRAFKTSPALLTGLNYRLSISRSRHSAEPDSYRKKPSASAREISRSSQVLWGSRTAWSG